MKLCVDCQYCNFNHSKHENSTCGAPQNYTTLISPVTGAHLPRAETCGIARVIEELCGPSAKWFLADPSYRIGGVSLYEMHNDPARSERHSRLKQERENLIPVEDL